MSLNASEFYEAGLTLPPSVRKEVALRLLDSVEAADQDSIDDAWASAIASRVDEVLTGDVQTIPGDEVFARIAERRAARQANQQV